MGSSDVDVSLAFARIQEDVRAACAEVRPESSYFAQVRDDVLDAWSHEVGNEEERLVAAFEHDALSRLVTAAHSRVADYDEQYARLQLHDPALSKTDLLGALGHERDEVLHTQALASLLGSVSFGSRLLTGLLTAAQPSWRSEPLPSPHVDSEYTVTVGRKERRMDLVVKVGSRLLVVIENKIDAKDADGQLDDYGAWAEGQEAQQCILLYLTPSGAEPLNADPKYRWLAVSYLALLIEWRRVLRTIEAEATVSAWTDLLRLYLATLARHVCRIEPKRESTLAERLRLIDYLHAANGA